MNMEKVIKDLHDIASFIARRVGIEQARNFLRTIDDTVVLLKEQEEQIKNRDESLEKAREEIEWLRGMLKEQEAAYQGAVELLRQKTILFDDAIKRLKEQEAKKGQWIPIESPTGVEAFGVKEMTVMNVRCSVCGSEEDVSFTGYKYCPRCGAKMEGR